MFTTTFYSYKGGVGRTSALMNVAHRLCERDKTVCVLDFDLEAPGLDAYQTSTLMNPHQGVVEYITDFLASDAAPDLREYVVDISLENSPGRLFLMPAGKKDEAYQYSLSRLDWKMLYGKKNGYLIIEALRRHIANELGVDYLLVDSRTGLTDISGICTLQLPDLVVLVFNLNEQNIQGTAKVYKNVADNKLNRSIQTMLVASPIPDLPDSLEILSGRFDVARRAIGSSPDLVLPYDPFMCFQESIIADEQSRTLSSGYRNLTEMVISKNAKDVFTLLRAAAELREDGEMELAELKYQDTLEMNPKSGAAWFEYGQFARLSRSFDEAIDAFSKAIQYSSSKSRAYSELILTFLQVHRLDDAHNTFDTMLSLHEGSSEFLRLALIFADRGMFGEALLAVDRAESLDTDSSLEAIYTRAQSLAGLKRYDDAFREYDRYRRAFPTMLSAVFNAGATAALAGKKEARALLHKAVELYEGMTDKRSNARESANIYSAIAFAYEHLNNRQKAIEALQDSLTFARKSRGQVFLFPEYKYVPQEAFIFAISKRLEQLIEATSP
jgi:tetratricopeptide (TPR) repeat protein